MVFGDPYAVIPDGEFVVSCCFPALDHYFGCAFVGFELQGVCHQVLQHLYQPHLIAFYKGDIQCYYDICFCFFYALFEAQEGFAYYFVGRHQ